jgi:hypothetical protein
MAWQKTRNKRRKTMKKSILAILVSGTLAISIVTISCGQPAAQPAAIAAPTASPQAPSNAVMAAGTTEVERLEEMQRSVGMLINQYSMNGAQAPDYVYDQIRTIEKAKRDLLDLDGQRWATHMLIAQYVMSGQQVPDYDYELAQSIEQSRQEVLKRVGLAD